MGDPRRRARGHARTGARVRRPRADRVDCGRPVALAAPERRDPAGHRGGRPRDAGHPSGVRFPRRRRRGDRDPGRCRLPRRGRVRHQLRCPAARPPDLGPGARREVRGARARALAGNPRRSGPPWFAPARRARAGPAAARGPGDARRARARHRGRPRAHRVERLPARRRPGNGFRSREAARRRAGRHDRLGQPLHRGRASRGAVRPGRGGRIRTLRGPGDRAHSLRFTRPRPPGLHRSRPRHGLRPADVRDRTARPAARLCATLVAGGSGVPGRDGGGGELRLGEPACHGPRGAPGDREDSRYHRGGRHATGLRRRAQRGEARASRGAGGVRAPQGRDARFPGRLTGDPRALPHGRPASVHPREHGNCELRPRRRPGLDGAGVRDDLPRGRPADEQDGREAPGHGSELRRELSAAGIVVRCASNKGLAEEAPFAYKDVDRVVEVVERAGLARRVARLRPLGVVKG